MPSNRSYIAWLFPRGPVTVRRNGPVWDFDAPFTDPRRLAFRWEDAVKSVKAWVTGGMHVPVLMNHVSEVDEVTDEPIRVYGKVTDVFVWTAEEARARGVYARDLVESLYCVVEPNDELAELRSTGAVGLCSPGLEAGFQDDTGKVWPLALWEVSHTHEPRQRSRQPDPDTLRELDPETALSVALGDNKRGDRMKRYVRHKAKMNDGTPEDAPVVTPDTTATVDEGAAAVAEAGMPDAAEALQTLQAQVATLEANQAAMRTELDELRTGLGSGAPTPEPDAALQDDNDEEDKDKAIALTDRKRVSSLAAAAVDEEFEMRRLAAEYVVTAAQQATLRDLRRKSKAGYALAVEGLRKRATTQPGRAATSAALADRNASLADRARALASKEGIKFSEARARLQANGG